MFKWKSCELFLKIKTVIECKSYYKILKNYHDDPVDGLLWSNVETKNQKSYCDDPADNFHEQSQNSKRCYDNPVDKCYEKWNEDKKWLGRCYGV